MKSCVLWKDWSNGQTQNSGIWKTVHRYSWVVKLVELVDFLKKTMKDGHCVNAVRVECIEMAAIFIGLVDPSRRRWSQKQYCDEDRSNF